MISRHLVASCNVHYESGIYNRSHLDKKKSRPGLRRVGLLSRNFQKFIAVAAAAPKSLKILSIVFRKSLAR